MTPGGHLAPSPPNNRQCFNAILLRELDILQVLIQVFNNRTRNQSVNRFRTLVQRTYKVVTQ